MTTRFIGEPPPLDDSEAQQAPALVKQEACQIVRRETRSLRWPAFMFAYMTALAYLASFLLYQGGRLLGF